MSNRDEAAMMQDLTLSLSWNVSCWGRGMDDGLGMVVGPKLILPLEIVARMNSFIRSVGVPSIQECSPRKPDRPLSKTITRPRCYSIKVDKETTYVDVCRKTCYDRFQSTLPS